MTISYGHSDFYLPVSPNEIQANTAFQIQAIEREAFAKRDNIKESDFAAMVLAVCHLAVPEIPDDMPFGKIESIFRKDESGAEYPQFAFKISKKGEISLREPISLCLIYSHLLHVINSEEQVNFPIMHGGEWWTVADITGVLKEKAALNVREVVETLQIRKEFSDYLKAAEKEQFDFRKIGNVDFTLTAIQVSLLLRRISEDGKIEPLPDMEHEIERFAKERIEKIKAMPLSVINAVRFFFQNILMLYSLSRAKTAA